MPFSFTFKLPVPGLNPFSAPAETLTEAQPGGAYACQFPDHPRSWPTRPTNIHQRRPSPSPSPSAPTSRKRGWDPSLAEPSQSAATLASSSGYLDTPAKYRDMAARQPVDEFELEDMNISDLPEPPTKRRKTLAGSVVSAAVSAALIGTAVGLTVYRLWRDRSKEAEAAPVPQLAPPPPYHEGEWKPVQQPQAIEITPPTPMVTPRRRKVRASVTSVNRRQNHLLRPQIYGQTFSPLSPSRPPFDSSEMEDDGGAEATVEDKMDWIGDKLSMLIQEGQKALRSEIVVQSDAKEDEVDDGSGAWEEDGYDQEFGGPSSYRSSLSRSCSPRQRKRPKNLAPASSLYASRPTSASPRATRFEFMSSSLPSSSSSTSRWLSNAPNSLRGISADSELGSTNSLREEQDSPEVRELMAKARAQLRTKGTG
ncbi:hypothetical protein GGX14DRAFT_418869 [Mycena pura]|uniref:Uncharacterized protein n=1 Tax=Mycena pura TaxID=153505 RepID=A0AAD6YRW9_9AGAR|nr:hypothetical protein GGX14DRAFT_418869 [Mycena pura]